MGTAMPRPHRSLALRARHLACVLSALLPTAAVVPSSAAARAAAAGAHHAGKTSAAAIAIAALAALLALACLAWGIARLSSFEPRWAQSMRHTLAEAGFRASATWAEFSDWIRLGH
jgi:hypothetical protein